MEPPRRGSQIRESFLRFFEQRGHRRVPSASVVPASDPTLLFTNAGMVPFKRVFLGEETREYSRATSSQRCIRVSGRHDDLEEVGRSPIHHTFFEMLGNFSFGDYFKEQAIEWAWELLTDVWRLSPESLVVSVFRDDDETYQLWQEQIGVPSDRIYRLGEEENFWTMGDTGPCGPCTEVHYDRGPRADHASCDPSCDCGRWNEVWNLVFMQFNRDASGVLTPLPRPCVDTGAGLERNASVLQGVETNYDTDVFLPLLERAQDLSGVGLGEASDKDVSLRVVADHARSVAVLLAEGVLPSNEGRGYVLRRILRRAARHGVLLGLETPFLNRVSEVFVAETGGVFPELRERGAYIVERIRREEERFLETLGKGLAVLEEEVRELRGRGGGELAGEVVFRLYDTYGFPVDLTADILRGEGLTLDQAGFDGAMGQQRARGRAAWKGSGQEAVGEVYSRIAVEVPVEFRGYEGLEMTSAIRALLKDGAPVDEAHDGDAVEVIVEETPFYPESGGQVGDRGTMTSAGGRVQVEDTQKPVDGLIVHRGRVVEGRVQLDEPVDLQVDAERRQGAVRHHTGTHLLHAALREVLGPQAVQRGSLVAPDRLRFDFTHDAPVTPEELERIEDLVNAWIESNDPRREETLPYADALAAGAAAMFGEKYGDEVRVISFGDFSKELCGGTHARSTGEVGLLKVVAEGGVAAGVRRIEALSGREALLRLRTQEQVLLRTAELLRTPVSELTTRVEKLLDERRALEREVEELRAGQRRAASGDLVSKAREVGGVRVLATRVEGVGARELRALVDDLRSRLGSGVVLVAAERDDGVALALGVTPDLVERLKAGDLIRDVAGIVGGKGGGRPDFAQAGGRDASRLDEAFERLFALIEGG
jgi:alanyl-tRNA synthetase